MTAKHVVGFLLFAGCFRAGAPHPASVVQPRKIVESAPAASIERPRVDRSRFFAIRRNLFAFAELPATPPPHKTEPVAQTIAVVPAPQRAIETPAEPEFIYKYIGRFGPDANPIAVFAANGEIVNARIGDFIAGQFRLSGIGIESVDVTSATGAVRRVSLQP